MKPTPPPAPQANDNVQAEQADNSPKYSLGAWGAVIPPSAVPVNNNTEVSTREEHKRLLREAGCASDIFTACTPEELHAIADAELEEMTKTRPTQRGFELLKTWRDFHLDMICCPEYNRPWVKYFHREATEELEQGEGMFHQRITVKMKVDEVFKKAIYHNSPQAQLEKAIDDWTLEDLMKMPYLEPMKELLCKPDDTAPAAKQDKPPKERKQPYSATVQKEFANMWSAARAQQKKPPLVRDFLAANKVRLQAIGVNSQADVKRIKDSVRKAGLVTPWNKRNNSGKRRQA